MNCLEVRRKSCNFAENKLVSTMVKMRKYSSLEEFHEALKAAIAKKELLYKMLRAGATTEELEEAGIHLAPMK